MVAALFASGCENGATPPRLADSVAVTAPAASLMEGDSMRLTAVVRDASGLINRPVTWSSSSDAVATVSAAGTVRGVAPGTVTITAAADGKSGSVELTVASLVSSVEVTAPATSLVEGDTMRLSAVARDAAGNPLTGRAVAWSSSSDAVATVGGGRVTAVSAGTVTLTATVEGRSGSVELTVLPRAHTVTVQAPSSSLFEGDQMEVSATARDAAGNVLTGRAVAWSSSSDAVATVSAAGTVTAVAPGTTTITATVEGRTGTLELTVDARVASVTVVAPAGSMVAGDTMRLAAMARDAAGNPLMGRAVAWSTSSGAVATVSGAGTVTAVAAGTVTITATVEGKSGSVQLTIVPAVGTLVVTVETVGNLPDPDGYEITRNGQAVGRVGVNGTLQMPELEVGTYSVGVRDASPQCGVEGGSVRQSTVQRDVITTVVFRVECRRNGLAYTTWNANRTGTDLWVYYPGRPSHLLATGVDSRRTSWSPDGRRLAYSGNGIRIIDLDDGRVQRLTFGMEHSPAWSPDGSRLVYNSAGDLYEISPDGTGARILWQAPFMFIQRPAWSPDGTRIAFKRTHGIDHVSEIVTIAADGSDLRVVRRVESATYTSLTWSPDGTRLLYEDRTPDEPFRIYTAELATGESTLVYEVSGTDLWASHYTPVGRIGFTINSILWTVGTDGTGAAQYPLPDGFTAGNPAWQ